MLWYFRGVWTRLKKFGHCHGNISRTSTQLPNLTSNCLYSAKETSRVTTKKTSQSINQVKFTTCAAEAARLFMRSGSRCCVSPGRSSKTQTSQRLLLTNTPFVHCNWTYIKYIDLHPLSSRNYQETSMHSSRMRTDRGSGHLEGGGGVCLPPDQTSTPLQIRHPPPKMWTEWQTSVKT